MEDLASLLETSFKVSNDMFSTSAVHPRFSQYKSRNAGPSDQEVRRKRQLEQQKQSRYDYQNHVRNLAEGRFTSMETDQRQKYRGGKNYRDQLMLSEWMVEVPQDFEDNWIMMPCPVGKRALVVASYGQTSAWSKGGWLIGKFPSVLPGGCRSIPHWNRDSTVLDCIYSELQQTYYVLDMMCWKEQPHYDCESEFRFYWMATKLDEVPELKQLTKRNKFKFDVLPNFSCKAENIQNVLKTKMNVQLDGLLFYHKHTHYTIGSTPLVTWLKPYMVPDILGIPIGEEHMRYKPLTYTTFEAHLEQVKIDKQKAEEKEKARLERRQQRRSSQGMETTLATETASSLQPPQEPQTEALRDEGGDVTSPEAVGIEEEAEILDLSQIDVRQSSQGDNTRDDMSGQLTELIGDDNTMEESSHMVQDNSKFEIEQWKPTGNENPFPQESASQERELVTHEPNVDPIEAAPEANTLGEITISKSATRKEKKSQASSETAMEEDGAKKEKKKPKKLRGGRQIKGRTQ